MSQITDQLGLTNELADNKYAALLGIGKTTPANVSPPVPKPDNSNRTRKAEREKKLKAIHKMILKAPHTTEDVAEEFDLKPNTAYTYLQSLRTNGKASSTKMSASSPACLWRGL